jgi:hypothetical protein
MGEVRDTVQEQLIAARRAQIIMDWAMPEVKSI